MTIVQVVPELLSIKVMSSPGFDPWTFVSEVKSLTSVPTEPWMEADPTKPGFVVKAL